MHLLGISLCITYYTPPEIINQYTGTMKARRNSRKTDVKMYRFDITCEGKRFFATEAEALAAADARMFDHMSSDIGVYHCPTCLHWHLTSLKPKT